MRSIWKMLYPDVCPFCGKVFAKGICEDCRKKLKAVREPACKKCGKPLEDEQKEYCGDCEERIKSGECYFECGKSLWVHRPPVSGSVYQFKFQNRRIYGQYYAQEMAGRFGRWIQKRKIEVLVPVPMDSGKKRKRGYNQAEILALELGRILCIPVEKKLIRKKRRTTAQKSLNRTGREHNLKDSFEVERKTDLPERVLLIDDIYTTGNTVNEVSRILRKAGVKAVFFLTISIGQDI